MDGLNEAQAGNEQHNKYGCQPPAQRVLELGRQLHSDCYVLYPIQLSRTSGAEINHLPSHCSQHLELSDFSNTIIAFSIHASVTISATGNGIPSALMEARKHDSEPPALLEIANAKSMDLTDPESAAGTKVIQIVLRFIELSWKITA